MIQNYIPADIVNVLDYNANGNGIIDDSSPIISAINATPTGGVLYLPLGIFNLNGKTITINKSLHVFGNGTLKNGLLQIQHTSNITINGIKMLSSRIQIDTSTFILIQNCNFYDLTMDSHAIWFSGNLSDIDILDNEFNNINYLTSSSTYGCAIKSDLANCVVANVRIKRNKMSNIHGPANIWIGGNSGTVYRNLSIDSNVIKDTESFGIEFYADGDKILTFNDCDVKNNTIIDTGSIRPKGSGSGCGGIFGGKLGIHVFNNTLKRITEIAIEGGFETITNNIIEDTGSDQLNRATGGSSIYFGDSTKVISGNIIKNPGKDGGIYYYNSGIISNKILAGNIIYNEFSPWVKDTIYSIGDLVVSNGNWYICISGGMSGLIAPTGTISNISDGVCFWNFKKPFTQNGINLNGVNGIANLVIRDNTVMEIATAYATSGWNKNVCIINNLQVNDLVPVTNYLGGSGSRTCVGGVFIKP